MAARPLPRDLKKALALLDADPARRWTVRDLAAACGAAPRTLQKHCKAFLGCGPVQFIRELRLARARRDLLRASAGDSVTGIATRSGFGHLGRFSARYLACYGESPSATVRRRHRAAGENVSAAPLVCPPLDRPTIAVLPFDSGGPADRRAGALADEISAALLRLRWLTVTAPRAARYHLRGTVRSDAAGRLQVSASLVDASAGHYLWAHRWAGRPQDLFELEEQAAQRIAQSVQGALRSAEAERAWRGDPARLSGWGLSMRALPLVISFAPAEEMKALELLERAMESSPRDALPAALASWCRGLLGAHHFVPRPEEQRQAARALAARAAHLDAGDALTHAILAGGYTLAHDLEAAARHAERALALDGGSAWAWGRSGWVKVYAGEPAEAIERFRIARDLAPDDPLGFLWAIGIGSASLEQARYVQAIDWYERAMTERPTASWNDRFRAAAYSLAGRKDQARRTLASFAEKYPDVTITLVRAGLPHTRRFLDPVAEGLERAGMRL